MNIKDIIKLYIYKISLIYLIKIIYINKIFLY